MNARVACASITAQSGYAVRFDDKHSAHVFLARIRSVRRLSYLGSANSAAGVDWQISHPMAEAEQVLDSSKGARSGDRSRARVG
jgi:hypothetical protein